MWNTEYDLKICFRVKLIIPNVNQKLVSVKDKDFAETYQREV